MADPLVADIRRGEISGLSEPCAASCNQEWWSALTPTRFQEPGSSQRVGVKRSTSTGAARMETPEQICDRLLAHSRRAGERGHESVGRPALAPRGPGGRAMPCFYATIPLYNSTNAPTSPAWTGPKSPKSPRRRCPIRQVDRPRSSIRPGAPSPAASGRLSSLLHRAPAWPVVLRLHRQPHRSGDAPSDAHLARANSRSARCSISTGHLRGAIPISAGSDVGRLQDHPMRRDYVEVDDYEWSRRRTTTCWRKQATLPCAAAVARRRRRKCQ